jgi:biopolymer transport protein ExbD
MGAPAAFDDDAIVAINVTPLVDIVLVLLVILMVTASYVQSHAIPLEPPRAATGEAAPAQLAITVDARGQLFVGAERVDETELVQRVRLARAQSAELVATIAADGRARHAQVVHVVDLLRGERVTKFAFDVDPAEPAP